MLVYESKRERRAALKYVLRCVVRIVMTINCNTVRVLYTCLLVIVYNVDSMNQIFIRLRWVNYFWTPSVRRIPVLK